MPGDCCNHHDHHNCDCFVDNYMVQNSLESYYLQGLPPDSVILEAISQPCDGTCIESKYGGCSRHIELQCCKNGKEFYHLLVGEGADYLWYHTKVRIWKIIPQVSSCPICPQCGTKTYPSGGHCFTCLNCGWSACS